MKWMPTKRWSGSSKRRLGETTPRMPLNTVVVLVDAIRPSQLNAVAENGDWSHLIAMLILTFPEIHWIFGLCAREKDTVWNSIATNHDLRSLSYPPSARPASIPPACGTGCA